MALVLPCIVSVADLDAALEEEARAAKKGH
jgi:hypothetical protein